MSDPRLDRPLWRGRTNVDALTIACIEHAESRAGHEFTVTQGSYQPPGEGDSKSAGTHDGGGVVDLRWCGHNACIGHLRRAGMAAWHRVPPTFDHHIHAVVLGHPLLSDAAHRQVIAYLNGRNGLANDGADDGPRFDPIPRPVWPWPEEDDMPTADEVAAAVLARKMTVKRGDKEVSLPVEQVLRETFQRAERVDYDRIARSVAGNLAGAGIDPEVIEAAVKDALREGTG